MFARALAVSLDIAADHAIVQTVCASGAESGGQLSCFWRGRTIRVYVLVIAGAADRSGY